MPKPYTKKAFSVADFDDWCANVRPHIGKGVTVELSATTEKPKRSDEQNKYYWGVIIGTALAFYSSNIRALIEDLMKAFKFDVTADFIHGLFKLMFNGGKSTTDLKTDSMNEYWNKIREHFYHEHQIDIPQPNKEELTNNGM